jgi:hypothetical protein
MSSNLKVLNGFRRNRSSSDGSRKSQDMSVDHGASADPDIVGTIDYCIDVNSGQSKMLNHLVNIV